MARLVQPSRPIGRTVAALAVIVLSIWALALAPGGVPALDAATTNRAAVIVDDGAQVRQVVITFTEDSISGLQALERAGASPVVWNYTGQGGAVCALFGVGRAAGPNCLGGADGDSRYWAYFRAAAGTGSFTYARACACTARVSDGDVEGWRWGNGQAPAFATVDQIAGPAPTVPSPPQPVGSPPAPGGAAGEGTGTGAALPSGASTPAPASGAAPVGAPPVTGAAPGPVAATGAGPGPEESTVDVAGRRTSSTRPSGDDERAANLDAAGGSGSGSAWSLLGFAAVAATLGAGIVIARRARRAAAVPEP